MSVNILRQSRRLYFVSRSKRLYGVANAAPIFVSHLWRLINATDSFNPNAGLLAADVGIRPPIVSTPIACSTGNPPIFKRA
jgi:hypothetical protein